VWQGVWTGTWIYPAPAGGATAWTPMIIDNQVQEGKKAHSAYVATFHDCGLVGLTALAGAVRRD